jgi:PPOX class probable FMN-dependent enzyme
MPSSNLVTSLGELQALYRPAGRGALDKVIDRLDDHCRDFIAHSPFVVISTADHRGRCDASPKGGRPGFVQVLGDEQLAWGDLSGNNRLDSMRNLISNAGIALLFLIPGLDETLRVNGEAVITKDPVILERCTIEGTVPRVAVSVIVREAYIHCAKAFRRSALWEPTDWPDRSDMASAACMLRDHAELHDVEVGVIEEALETSYERTLWQAGGHSASEDMEAVTPR